MNNEQLIQNLRIRARIRSTATGRKSIEEGKPDRLIELLENAADTIEVLDQAVYFWQEKYQRERRRVYEQAN